MAITNLLQTFAQKLKYIETYRGKSAFGQGKVGISTPWIGLEFEQDNSPTVLPWNEPLKDKHCFIMIEQNTGYSISDKHILSTINPKYDFWFSQIYKDLHKFFWNSNLEKLMFWISEICVNLCKSDKIRGCLLG